jgi:deoxyribodipyrimidine photo-lyase
MGADARPVILWFRQDLRLADNPALAAAVASGRPLLPLYILDEATPGLRPMGGASRWWLAGSLESLSAALAKRGAALVMGRGAAAEVLDALIAETGAAAVHWNRCYEPGAIARDKAIKARLQDRGIAAESHNGALLAEPWTVKTGSGGPFKVFTPFWQALRRDLRRDPPLPAPKRIPGLGQECASDPLASWNLRPSSPDWAAGLREAWTPGERSAKERLKRFVDESSAIYASERDRPDREGTARLSPHLHWGEISPRQVWRTIESRAAAGNLPDAQATAFLRQLAWREFSHHLLFHWPDLPDKPWQPAFASFPWRKDPALLAAWQRGRTGYPLVDAAMRELRVTGWMHNRVRMVAASFLVKHLLQPWRAGEAWFWDTLVDADLAQNAANWQWVAGSGADAAPYFRIFNPVLQGQRFDAQGRYVRRWLPALARLPDRFIHAPWRAPADVLAAAGITLGRDYPPPIVDHDEARQRALAAYQAIHAPAAAVKTSRRGSS